MSTESPLYESKKVEHQCCIHCSPEGHWPHTFDGCPKPEPTRPHFVDVLQPNTVNGDKITPDNPGLKNTLHRLFEEFNPGAVVVAAMELSGMNVETVQPHVINHPGFCVMCYAADATKMARVPASFIACGHSVCPDHLDEVLEAGN